MRVLVAGGSGFIGRATVDALREAGHQIVVVSRKAQREGVDVIRADLGTKPPSPEEVGPLDAIVNLVGIARVEGENTFERAHVQVVRNLVGLAHAVKCDRFVHVSVVRVARARGRYFETKARGEGTVEGSGLRWTILRPGLVYGPGDQMMTRLIQLARLSAGFVVPGGRCGPLQVVDVRDVALAVVRSLEHERSVGRFYDVVGPHRYSLSELMNKVARSLGLSIVCVALPRMLMRTAVEVGHALMPDPLVTRTQLGMLVSGLYGEGEPARRELGLKPRPLTQTRIRELATDIRDLAPSPRIVTGLEHRQWLDAARPAMSALRWFLPALMLALLVLPHFVSSVWVSMGLVNACFAGLALAAVPLPWKALWRPNLVRVGVGLAAGTVMYAAALGVLELLRSLTPAFVVEAGQVLAWAELLPTPWVFAALVAIVLGEDIVWRGAVALPLAARIGPWRGSLIAGASFALAHLTTGPPVLWLAAFLAGSVWSLLAVRTRSLVPVFVTHVGWDVAMVLTGVS